jgi:hypothetical protein
MKCQNNQILEQDLKPVPPEQSMSVIHWTATTGHFALVDVTFTATEGIAQIQFYILSKMQVVLYYWVSSLPCIQSL